MKVRYYTYCTNVKTESLIDSVSAPGNPTTKRQSQHLNTVFQTFNLLHSLHPHHGWGLILFFSWFCHCDSLFCVLLLCVCVFGQFPSSYLPYLRQFCQRMSPLLLSLYSPEIYLLKTTETCGYYCRIRTDGDYGHLSATLLP